MAIEQKRTKRRMAAGFVAGGMVLGAGLMLVVLAIFAVDFLVAAFGG